MELLKKRRKLEIKVVRAPTLCAAPVSFSKLPTGDVCAFRGAPDQQGCLALHTSMQSLPMLHNCVIRVGVAHGSAFAVLNLMHMDMRVWLWIGLQPARSSSQRASSQSGERSSMVHACTALEGWQWPHGCFCGAGEVTRTHALLILSIRSAHEVPNSLSITSVNSQCTHRCAPPERPSGAGDNGGGADTCRRRAAARG